MAESALSKLGRDLSEFRKSPQTPVTEVLEAFTAITIGKLKRNLANKGRKASGALEQSIAPQPLFLDDDGNLVLEIEMENYWDFINQGVDGTESKWGSEYLFRPLAQAPSTEPPSFKESIKEWIAFKGINSLTFKDKDGNFVTKFLQTESDFESAAFVFMNAIKKGGIEPSFFVDDALTDEVLDELTEGIADAIAKQFEQ